ncbi:MAG: hybrid sensor histidine kinase/response regulator [Verrucomicrobiota bacterium]
MAAPFSSEDVQTAPSSPVPEGSEAMLPANPAHDELERLREQDAELIRVNQIKDQFLAILAHELRNPLAPILNAVELLRSPEPGDAVEIIERQVKHIARLLEDLLDLSRITQGKIILHQSRIDLVESARLAARSSCCEKEHVFILDLCSEPLWIEADPVRIEQIIGNLLNNAIKYTEAGKSIRLSVQREGEEAVLRVQDEGLGVPPEMLERIFEPFVQISESLERARGGLGLGLPLVRQLVEIHHGTVTAHSAGLGRGSEFVVRLPLATSPKKKNGNTLETCLPHPEPARHRILVVEDNADLSGTLCRLLTAWGHTVEVSSTGSDAIAKAIKFKPDIVMVDIGLPDLNGYEVGRQLSRLPELPELLLIAMSGYRMEADELRATEAGFKDYLLKPFDPSELRSRFQRGGL